MTSARDDGAGGAPPGHAPGAPADTAARALLRAPGRWLMDSGDWLPLPHHSLGLGVRGLPASALDTLGGEHRIRRGMVRVQGRGLTARAVGDVTRSRGADGCSQVSHPRSE